MNVAMFTNTFTPHVGGVARSVQGQADELRRLGHRVLVVAPRFDTADEDETGVLRIPAVQNFNGSDFSVPVPAPLMVTGALNVFKPDIVHSHHPFLLGHTALRIAASGSVPVVFTHHTRYEQYTHYLPGDSALLKHFVMELVIGYCNLCNTVVAPSRSIAEMLQTQEVKAPIEVIPTGVDRLYFAAGDPGISRRRLDIPEDAFVLGHVGRLAPEKNLPFLADSICGFLAANPAARFLLIGEGSARAEMLGTFARRGLMHRIHLLGVVLPRNLADAYRCMDVFVFASQSETQGIVLAEAMASGTPVVAIDAPGVREIVVDGVNGRLLPTENVGSFVLALAWLAQLPTDKRAQLRRNARRSAKLFSRENCAKQMIDLYARLIGTEPSLQEIDDSRWQRARNRIKKEIEILKNYGHAIEDTLQWMPQRKETGKPDRNPSG